MSGTEILNGPGLAVIISGPSAAGKTTICKRLVERAGYEVSVSATTRAPRSDEREGKDYFFVSPDVFDRMIAQGELLEFSEHFGNRYGTPAAPVCRAVSAGRTILLEIDVNGARQLSSRIPNACFIFVVAPDHGEMERRLRNRRSDSEASVRERLQRADMEMAADMEIAERMRYHGRVVNDDLEKAVEQVHSLIRKAEARKSHERGTS